MKFELFQQIRIFLKRGNYLLLQILVAMINLAITDLVDVKINLIEL
ncbi:MAG: hypothetical protein OHM56_01665 [Spiroplasma phoeniceum]|nr:MAG: hypothetical protein OHM56_01665 [Spiroplasma phoeniceum]